MKIFKKQKANLYQSMKKYLNLYFKCVFPEHGPLSLRNPIYRNKGECLNTQIIDQ